MARGSAKSVVTGGGDSFLRFWDIASGPERRKFQVEGEQQLMDMTVTRDGKTLVASTAGLDRSAPQYLTAWDIATGEKIFEKKKKSQFFHAEPQTVSPDGKIVVSAKDRGLVLEEAASGRELCELSSPLERRLSASSVVFSQDGTLVAARSSRDRKKEAPDSPREYSVSIFDVATGKERHALVTTGSLMRPAFSPDGKTLGAPGDECVHLFDLTAGKELRRFAGLDSDARCVAFSRDGNRLAAGLENTTVLVWDVGDTIPAK